MGFRTFVDRDGHAWEVRDRSRTAWEFEPIRGNPDPRRTVRPPGYERDPFELSERELQRLLDGATGPRGRQAPSPFQD